MTTDPEPGSRIRVIGVDVQRRRGCPWIALDGAGTAVGAGWLPPGARAPAEFDGLVRALRADGPVTVAIDAPRRPLAVPRAHAFRGGAWRPMSGGGLGRHCEVVVKSLGLANPQWTPLLEAAPDWMRLGFDLFDAAGAADRVLEVFPTATYRSLHEAEASPTVRISLAHFAPGPKDMLDAVAAATTGLVRARGRGCEVGGGDGLGTIALPRALTEAERASAVHDWPI